MYRVKRSRCAHVASRNSRHSSNPSCKRYRASPALFHSTHTLHGLSRRKHTKRKQQLLPGRLVIIIVERGDSPARMFLHQLRLAAAEARGGRRRGGGSWGRDGPRCWRGYMARSGRRSGLDDGRRRLRRRLEGRGGRLGDGGRSLGRRKRGQLCRRRRSGNDRLR